MKFWLTCFVLLFAGAEFFQWMVTLGGEGLSGAWLVLGGMGLAAASNAKHLPRLAVGQPSGAQGLTGETDGEPPATATSQPINPPARQAIAPKETAKETAKTASGATQTSATTSDEDSISFKVRLPWR